MMAGNSDKTGKKKRGPGKPFQPGQSGNPSGRPSLPDEVKTMLESYAPEAVRFQYKTMNDSEAPYQVRVKCSELLADRGLGKPIQSVNVEGKGPMLIVLKDDMEGV